MRRLARAGVVKGAALCTVLALAAAAARADDGAAGAAVVVYESPSDYSTTRENLESAILDQGLVLSGTLHVSEMLERTGEDLGFPEQVYVRAESLEFCSALLSQRMVVEDPANLVICPFTIALYIKQSEPDQVYVAFRRHHLVDAKGEVTKAVFELLDTIVREALSW